MAEATEKETTKVSTARALEIVLSRCKLDPETARILRERLAFERGWNRDG